MHIQTSLRFIAVAAICLAVLVHAPAIAFGQDNGTLRKEAEDPRGRGLLDVAIGVDGGLGADLVLRLLETDQLRTSELRREARDIARTRLSEADDLFPVDFVNGPNINCVDCRERLRWVGLSILPVDALSLRCRLALQVLKVSPKEALELLLELPPGLALPKAGCGDVLIPMPGVFFKSLQVVLPAATSASEKKEGVHWEVARRYVGGVETVSSIGPACDLVSSTDAPPNVVESLSSDLANAIDKMEASPREILNFAEWKHGLDAIATLLERLHGSEATQNKLRKSMRGLVLRSLAAPRCGDLPPEPLPAEQIGYFNETLLADHPIVLDDVKQPGRSDRPTVASLWISPTSRRMLLDFQNMNTARKEMELRTDADWTEWKVEFRKYAARVRSWSSVDEADDFDYIAQKTSLIAGLIDNAPDSASRQEAIRDFVVMMRHAKTASTPPHLLLWFGSVSLSRATSADRTMALEMFKSGPGLLSAYATFQLEGIDVFRIVGPPSTSP